MKKILLALMILALSSAPFLMSADTNPAECQAYFTRTLLYGDGEDQVSHDEVSKVQQFLIDQHYLTAITTPTGFFGSLTREAMKKWQIAKGLTTQATSLNNIYWGPGSIAKANIAKCGLANSIKLTYPNGGEKWEIGKNYTVTYVYSGPEINASIYLKSVNGDLCKIGEQRASLGSFSFTLTNNPCGAARSLMPGRYDVVVTANGLDRLQDSSDQKINLVPAAGKSVSFTSPIYNAEVVRNTSVTYAWVSEGYAAGEKARIYLYSNIGASQIKTPFSGVSGDYKEVSINDKTAILKISPSVLIGHYKLVMKDMTGNIIAGSAIFHVGANTSGTDSRKVTGVVISPVSNNSLNQNLASTISWTLTGANVSSPEGTRVDLYISKVKETNGVKGIIGGYFVGGLTSKTANSVTWDSKTVTTIDSANTKISLQPEAGISYFIGACPTGTRDSSKCANGTVLFSLIKGGTGENGRCGTAHGKYSAGKPTANLCAAGSSVEVSPVPTMSNNKVVRWNWTCVGSNGISAQCEAPAQNVSTVRVISPNGGEEWGKGTTQTITWERTGTAATVREAQLTIALEDKPVSGYQYKTIPNTGTYSLVVPETFAEGSRYKVWIGVPYMDGASFMNPGDGSDGNFSVKLSAPNYRVPIPGVCNAAYNEKTLTDLPVSGLCTNGNQYNLITNSNGWSWACLGSNGGATDQCSAIKQTGSNAINAVCGPATTNTPTSNGPVGTLCSAGRLKVAPMSIGGYWAWDCLGENNGLNKGCSVKQAAIITEPTPAACGPARTRSFSSAPTSADGLCSAGTPSSVTGSAMWSWTCGGTGMIPVTCTASKSISVSLPLKIVDLKVNNGISPVYIGNYPYIAWNYENLSEGGSRAVDIKVYALNDVNPSIPKFTVSDFTPTTNPNGYWSWRAGSIPGSASVLAAGSYGLKVCPAGDSSSANCSQMVQFRLATPGSSYKSNMLDLNQMANALQAMQEMLNALKK